ncbi:hypothetical protein SBI67_08465 [Mycolicibacterium sp. 120266]|uniref:hypothetical protein n=1 Tax=Mycolicibacterium sp. 120266 TaxID=3090601 RepID=UPI00299D3B64|nr:hypothetical protein [Mycolicibacterium sp. 120266]MDX1872150.1 hypothetical protein [Mycolicibacterium sp. 120266]
MLNKSPSTIAKRYACRDVQGVAEVAEGAVFSHVSSGALALATLSVLALSTASPAQADDPLVGKTYAEAQGKIAGDWQATAIVASAVGDVLARDKCIVTSWRKSSRLDASGYPIKPAAFMLHLNCNPAFGGATSPGGSITTPEGRAAKSTMDKAAALNNNPAWCDKSDKNHAYCERFCNLHGDLCTFTVS